MSSQRVHYLSQKIWREEWAPQNSMLKNPIFLRERPGTDAQPDQPEQKGPVTSKRARNFHALEQVSEQRVPLPPDLQIQPRWRGVLPRLLWRDAQPCADLRVPNHAIPKESILQTHLQNLKILRVSKYQSPRFGAVQKTSFVNVTGEVLWSQTASRNRPKLRRSNDHQKRETFHAKK